MYKIVDNLPDFNDILEQATQEEIDLLLELAED